MVVLECWFKARLIVVLARLELKRSWRFCFFRNTVCGFLVSDIQGCNQLSRVAMKFP